MGSGDHVRPLERPLSRGLERLKAVEVHLDA